MPTLPLLPEADAAQPVAWRLGQPIGRGQFLAEVQALAERMPPATHVLNVCKDRYAFAVALLAAMRRGVRTELPSSAAPEGIAGLFGAEPGGLCLGDQPEPPALGLSYLRVDAGAAPAPAAPTATPRIEAQCHVLTVFTSGSTGQPQAHRKSYGRLLRNVQGEASVLWGAAGGACSVVGTVPSQHMYGLESTVLMPLLAGGSLSARVPFFPADIAAALAEVPAPRLLVTTPFHLRNLLAARIELPPVAAVLCSTATLAPELAAEAEQRLGAPLLEIYGSSETGQMAHRRSAREREWSLLPGITLARQGEAYVAQGGHLEQSYVLNDTLDLLDDGRFLLLGRNADMVNIAGKRSSLSFLNTVLAGVPGLRDGVFVLPEPGPSGDVERLAAIVVAPGLSAQDILAALRTRIDPLFLPRPLLFVDALPRNETGKLPAAALRALLEQHAPRRP
jgi:acyl-coenzyme A synthetase/AMP-(fatty) acid ligase